ncbi:MAG: glycosyltransferase family 2 protein, partial [Candidatus Heimdallarchaeaceae archaeon]
MIKIFMTVRNRLEITKKAIEALERHSVLKYQLYVYDNQTNYLIEEHFEYFMRLYSEGKITQVTFNTDASTFNAFSKASSCNAFGLQHNQDPKKDSYDYLVMLDNDIIVVPNWDAKLKRGWEFVTKSKLNNIKVIGQLPGGIKNRTDRYE